MPAPLNAATLLLIVMVIKESVDPSELKSNNTYLTLFFLIPNEKKVNMLNVNDLLKLKIYRI